MHVSVGQCVWKEGRGCPTFLLMGCLCSKNVELDVDDAAPERSKSLNRIVTLKKDEVVAAIMSVAISGSHGSARFSSKRQEDSDSSASCSSDEDEDNDSTVGGGSSEAAAHNSKRATVDVAARRHTVAGANNMEDDWGIVDVPNGHAGEHVAAGWPCWLASVAPEAVNGWLPRRGDSFEKLDKVN